MPPTLVGAAIDELDVSTPRVAPIPAHKLEQANAIEPVWRVITDDAVASPSPLSGPRAQTCLNWVQSQVAKCRPELTIAPDPDRAISALEEMPDAAVSLVEGLGVQAVERLHPDCEIRVRRLQDKVDVVRHQAVGKASPVPLLDDTAEQPEIRLTIEVVQIDRLLRVPTRVHVKDPVLDLFPEWPCHAG
jgi:hypothetical protein